MITAEEHIASFYIGYYDHAADSAELAYWVDRHQAGMTLEEIAEHFARAEETRSIYGDVVTAQQADDQTMVENFLAAVYQHLFGRAVNAEGLAYWSERLTSDDPGLALSFDQAINHFIGGVRNEDLLLLDNKVEASLILAEREASQDDGQVYSLPELQIVAEGLRTWN